ncbi:MAG: DEAD/DEAH box helicase [Candidatus Moranbacteria bacterium CG_4_9_14_3_um_filter_40_7]|nr:MAG: DEAD/DEAH box helicase [Candidatus Moranbacteria bacterium CG06_land_8_20_14_3_00_40_12]PJA88049.1 MAG: DEAD/DEAH box helicase [Candidatus Moranbacteria bacterium CG_4_9_14_3_um_filter_40_7]
MTKITESNIEEIAIEFLEAQGYQYLSPEGQETERENLSEVVLKKRLKDAINRINPYKPEVVREQAFKAVFNLVSQNLIESNEEFHRMLTDGIDTEFLAADGIRGNKVWLIDFENIENNDFVVCNQFTVKEKEATKRPDLVLFVNGLPLVVIELKNPADENATVKKAFMQLQNYKNLILALFNYNAILAASDGLDAKAGSLTAGWSRFAVWKNSENKKEDKKTVPQLETLIKGMLRPKILLDLIKHFTVFEKAKKKDSETGQVFVETVKKIAAYHQFYAVQKAVESTEKAASENGDRRCGVVWHTQGSGKSLSMVFYAGKIIQKLNNLTILIITDRNDLDDQLFDTFASCKQILRQDPVQVENRNDLKKKLKVAGGGIVFSTIQKFMPEDGGETFDLLSDRKNIIVIADEAHRSQYGFKGKITFAGGGAQLKYGFAKYVRDALPNASFIGFTGTPIETTDKSTPAVFGDYIDVYDIQQAVKDGATVPIYYENRLVKVHLKEEDRKELDEVVDQMTEKDEPVEADKAKAKWARIEAIVGQQERLKAVANDIVEHYEKRSEAVEGKAMIVTMSRRIAVALCNEIIKLRPTWQNRALDKGTIKVVMTTTMTDPADWQAHCTTKEQRRKLADRFKDPSDSLKLVIVRDMWLTGFDAPCAKVMYVDKLMRGHNLMQAIARVNRVYKDIRGGLIVDYIGIARDLKKALAVYTESGGQGIPTLNLSEAASTMQEKFEIIEEMFSDFKYKDYFSADINRKMQLLLEAQEHVLQLPDGKKRFIEHIETLMRSYALVAPRPEAMAIKEALAFFQAVKVRLVKFESAGGKGRDSEEIETAIRQIVDKALASEGVIDIFSAAGIKKPDVSILSEEFLAEVRGMDRKNLALELMKKLLNNEIDSIKSKNIVLGRKFSEMLDDVLKRYQSNILTAAEIIEEMIGMAREIRGEGDRKKKLGLVTDYEVAFYDALTNNASAKEVLSHEVLRELACVLVDKVKENTSIDWTIRESARAKLRVMIKRTLNKFGYPPDMQKLATDLILKQAELFADDTLKN